MHEKDLSKLFFRETIPRFCLFVWVGILVTAIVMTAARAAEIDASTYDATIARARQGDTAPAISQLQSWLLQSPQNVKLRRDLVVIAGWGERHALALETFAPLIASEQPPYVLAAAALSARRQQSWPLAASLYRAWLAAEPANGDAQAGVALSLLGAGDVAAASAAVEGYLPAETTSRRTAALVPLLEALAMIREQQSRWPEALAAWQDVLSVRPTLVSAQRALLFVTSRLGATSVAAEMLRRTETLAAPDTQLRLRQDLTANMIRWGDVQLSVDTGLSRFGWTDRSLSASRVDREQASSNAPRAANALFDRMIAARNRIDMQEVVRLFDESERGGVVLPGYARAVVGDALLYLRQPHRGRDQYLRALADYAATTGTLQPEWKFSLLYAYVETEQWSLVAATADELVAYFQPFRNSKSALQQDEAGYARARVTQALVNLYGDQLDLAGQRIQEIITLAPNNVSARAALASWYAANDMPRHSNEEFLRIKAEDPIFLGGRLGLAETELSLARWQSAEAQSAEILRQYPESRAAQRLDDMIQARHAPELRLSSTLGSPLGELSPTQALRDRRIDAYGYSSPFSDHYRLFAHAFWSRADFVDRMARRERLGLGAEASFESVAGAVELHADTLPTHRVGLALSVSITPTDEWRARASFDSNTTDIALKASQAGVAAQQFSIGVERKFAGLNAVSGSVNHYRFSDGNERTSVSGNWHQRWLSAASFKFDTDVSLGASKNSRSGTSYFNPSADASGDVTAVLEWLTWRSYERSFRQRVMATAGSYWQEQYGTGSVLGARYEQEWERARHYVLRYGAGWTRRPFDGRQEQRLQFFLDLGWKLR